MGECRLFILSTSIPVTFLSYSHPIRYLFPR